MARVGLGPIRVSKAIRYSRLDFVDVRLIGAVQGDPHGKRARTVNGAKGAYSAFLPRRTPRHYSRRGEPYRACPIQSAVDYEIWSTISYISPTYLPGAVS
jgi:hypothetical protein